MSYRIVVAVHNDEAVLHSTLLRSPILSQPNRLMCQRNFPTVGAAYNAAINECDDEYLVFVHPDVYLPCTWHDDFERSISWLQENDPNWGVLGLFGVASDGSRHGFTFSTGIGSFLGIPFSQPREIRTVDEFVFILRRESGLAFDQNLPTAQNHFAATDLCLAAKQRNMRSYVIPCFALHNSNRWSFLPFNFWKSYLYIRKKWRSELPVEAPYATLTVGCRPMFSSIFKSLFKRRSANLRVATRVDDPSALYNRLCRNMSSSLDIGQYNKRELVA